MTTDPEKVLQQTLHVLAGAPARTEGSSPARVRGPRGSDRRWLFLIGILALFTGMVLGVGSLWLF